MYADHTALHHSPMEGKPIAWAIMNLKLAPLQGCRQHVVPARIVPFSSRTPQVPLPFSASSPSVFRHLGGRLGTSSEHKQSRNTSVGERYIDELTSLSLFWRKWTPHIIVVEATMDATNVAFATRDIILTPDRLPRTK